MDKTINFEPAEKLKKLPPYLFSQINQLKQKALENNMDIIDLGMGNPDMPTPKHIVERLCETAQYHPKTHRYPQAKGMPKFRKTVAEWFHKRFNVKLDPESETLALIGSKEGIAHLCSSILNPGDLALIPDPAYPVYYNSTILANAEPYTFPLLEKNGFLPDLTLIPEEILRNAKILFLNYPNNPTGAVIEDMNFLKELVKFAKKYELLICYDNAYSEITFDNYIAPSILQVDGAKDICVEFHSFSKTFAMAGWRVGFVVGNQKIVSMLEKFKSFVDYGVPTFIQLAAVAALTSPPETIDEMRQIYARRMDIFVNGLNKAGWNVKKPKATMYIWAKLPEKFKEMGSLEFSKSLLLNTGIATAPGIGFGKCGEGYVRFALVTNEERLHTACSRIRKFIHEKVLEKCKT